MKQHLEPVEIIRYEKGNLIAVSDLVSIEAPLGIRLVYGAAENRVSKDLSITMRTPGADAELALGFLFTEGIIRNRADVMRIEESTDADDAWVQVELRADMELDLNRLERHFYTTSSCGVCGKTSIAAIQQVCPVIIPRKKWQISQEILRMLPDVLRKSQNNFEYSGGIHACGAFNLQGELWAIREDIGRHNALDKLIGFALEQKQVPCLESVLLLSGRASFELVQKASMAGFRMVCSIGAPSSMALELAQEFDMSLIGFLKENRFNIYNGAERICL